MTCYLDKKKKKKKKKKKTHTCILNLWIWAELYYIWANVIFIYAGGLTNFKKLKDIVKIYSQPSLKPPMDNIIKDERGCTS
jgi:hypothetical protein